MWKDRLIIVRGGGDLATGTIYRLWKSGFRVLVLETDQPAAIRRQVSLCEAVYEGSTTVEDLCAVKIDSTEKMDEIFESGKVPVLVDPDGACIKILKPDVVVDAILAKKNLGTYMDMAPLTIGLGPGFTASGDVHVVIETMRGHDLGRILTEGEAVANTGIPGNIGGYTKERVIHSPAAGTIRNICKLGDIVQQGDVIALIESDGKQMPVSAALPGTIRGLIRDGYPVTEGFKIADIDPREKELQNCFTISDKARCIAGSVLEAVCRHFSQQK